MIIRYDTMRPCTTYPQSMLDSGKDEKHSCAISHHGYHNLVYRFQLLSPENGNQVFIHVGTLRFYWPHNAYSFICSWTLYNLTTIEPHSLFHHSWWYLSYTIINLLCCLIHGSRLSSHQLKRTLRDPSGYHRIFIVHAYSCLFQWIIPWSKLDTASAAGVLPFKKH